MSLLSAEPLGGTGCRANRSRWLGKTRSRSH